MTTDTLTDTQLRFERQLPAPVETVWRYLVEPELRTRWFCGGSAPVAVGQPVIFAFDHDALSSEDVPTPEEFAGIKGHSSEEIVTVLDAPHRLGFTFLGDRGGEALIELSALHDGGTRLVLTHSRLAGRDQAKSFGGGWTSHLAVLEAVIAGGGVRDFWALHVQSRASVAAALEAAA